MISGSFAKNRYRSKENKKDLKIRNKKEKAESP
jgi:hypothetical protein